MAVSKSSVVNAPESYSVTSAGAVRLGVVISSTVMLTESTAAHRSTVDYLKDVETQSYRHLLIKLSKLMVRIFLVRSSLELTMHEAMVILN